MTDDNPVNAAIARLLAIMARLRDPEHGCPWDIEQTFASIAPYTIEEAYEVADAIERGDPAALREELGDLLLQVVFHARMAEERQLFAFNDVVGEICDKLIRRHPHIFGDAVIEDAHEQTRAWEEHKARERDARHASRSEAIEPGPSERALSTSSQMNVLSADLSTSSNIPAAGPTSSTSSGLTASSGDSSTSGKNASALAHVPLNLPALTRAQKLQQRAARVGFDWPDAEGAAAKLAEEWAELSHELAAGDDRERLADELGDVLFSVVNLARKLGFDAETVLRHANHKFERRFRDMEGLAEPSTGQPFAALSLDRQEALWRTAKGRARQRGSGSDDENPA